MYKMSHFIDKSHFHCVIWLESRMHTLINYIRNIVRNYKPINNYLRGITSKQVKTIVQLRYKLIKYEMAQKVTVNPKRTLNIQWLQPKQPGYVERCRS